MNENDSLRRSRLQYDSLIVHALLVISYVWDRVSAYNWFIRRVGRLLRGQSNDVLDQRRSLAWAGEIYVLLFLLLVAVCWLIAGLNPVLDLFLAVIVAWRGAEILLVQLRIPLVDTEAPGHGLVSVPRSVVLALINLLQIAIIFAALDHILAPGGFYDPSKGLTYTPHSPWGYLYLSWTTMLTLGSGYSLSSSMAKALVMAEVGSGLLLLAMSLPAFVGAINLRQLDKPAER